MSDRLGALGVNGLTAVHGFHGFGKIWQKALKLPPTYIIEVISERYDKLSQEDKEKTVANLKKLAKAAQTVWIATDEDREGEAIAWHLAEALNLDKAKTKRIVFHEITKSAIQKAIENPRDIDYHLVDAQQARRVLDRIVGYELSPVLWRKVKGGLSAGRVQSVSVRLIVEREREIQEFNSVASFRIDAEFSNEAGQSFKAKLPKTFSTQKEAYKFLETNINATFKVADLEKKPAKKARKGINPFTGEETVFKAKPASIAVKVRPLKKLKEMAG